MCNPVGQVCARWCGEEGLEFGCSGVFDGLVLVCGDVAGVVLGEEDAVGEE